MSGRVAFFPNDDESFYEGGFRMLFSAAVNPNAFSPLGITDELASREAESFLRDILDNGVLLFRPKEDVLGAMVKAAEQLSQRLNQRILILLEDLLKDKRKFIAPAIDAPPRGSGCFEQQKLRGLALAMDADIAICVDAGESKALEDLQDHGVEVFVLRDYSRSNTKHRRDEYRAPREILTARNRADCDDCLKRAVRYATTIVVADRMIGRAAKEAEYAPDKVRRHLHGVAYLIRLWSSSSPYCRHTSVDLVIITESGPSSVAIEATIRREFERLRGVDSCELKVDVKNNGRDAKKVFHARYLASDERCFRIDPGFDAIAELTHERGARRTVFCDGPSDANSRALAKIRGLSSARAPE